MALRIARREQKLDLCDSKTNKKKSEIKGGRRQKERNIARVSVSDFHGIMRPTLYVLDPYT